MSEDRTPQEADDLGDSQSASPKSTTYEAVVDEVEWLLDFPLGQNIRQLLVSLIEVLDERYEELR